MKKTRSGFLGILSLSIIVILAAGCFRPAAPDVTPTSAGGGGGTSPGGTDLEATAIANSTRAAQTLAAQTAEAAEGEEGEPTEVEEATPTQEPTETSSEPPASATPQATWTPTVAAATPVATLAPTNTPSLTGEITHVVQAGESLFQIALQYGTTVDAISEANGIVDPAQIYAGQVLTIPAGGQPTQPPASATTHVVQPGENLFRIALRYGVTYQRLAEYNGITDPSNIYVGQVLQIPPQ